MESFISHFSDESRDDYQNTGWLVIKTPDVTVNPAKFYSFPSPFHLFYANNLILPLPIIFYSLISLAWTPVYFIRKIFFFKHAYQNALQKFNLGASACFQAMGSLVFCLQLSLFLADAFQFCIWRKSTASLLTASLCPPLGFSISLLPPDHPPIMLLGIWASSILTILPAHCIPFRYKSVESTKSSYNL